MQEVRHAPVSQREAILAHLKRGWRITPKEALEAYGCFRLAARIHEIRKMGYTIHKFNRVLPNQKRVACYFMETK